MRQFQMLVYPRPISLLVVVFISQTLHAVSVTLSRYQVISYHNNVRRRERASDIKYMHWDDTLASKAARWTEHCYYQHELSAYGENIGYVELKLVNTKLDSDLVYESVESMMTAWYREHSVYHWSQRNCGSSCQYTQMVWSASTSVGCAVQACANMTLFGQTSASGLYMACYYWSRGNRVGEYPFTEGASCSGCAPNEHCINRLCYAKKTQVPMFNATRHWTYKLTSRVAAYRMDSDMPQRDAGTMEETEIRCRDSYRSLCPQWAKNGECVKHKRRMEHFCPASCNFCTSVAKQHRDTLNDGGLGNSCGDRFDTKQCFIWAVVGECRKNPRAMRQYCMKSCLFCEQDLQKTQSASKDGWVRPHFGCEDRLQLVACIRMREKGMCKSRSLLKAMKYNCKKTCRFCKTDESSRAVLRQGKLPSTGKNTRAPSITNHWDRANADNTKISLRYNKVTLREVPVDAVNEMLQNNSAFK